MEEIEVHLVETDEEYEECLRIRRTVFVQEIKRPEDLETDFHEQRAIYFLATANGKPVGTGRFRVKKSFLLFERIATLEEMRGKGVGKAILTKMQEEGFRRFPEHLKMLNALVNAIPFYEKLSWIPVGEEFLYMDDLHKTMIDPPKEPEKIKQLKCLEDPDTPQPILETLYKIIS